MNGLPSEALKKQVLHCVQDDKIYDENFRLRTLEHFPIGALALTIDEESPAHSGAFSLLFGFTLVALLREDLLGKDLTSRDLPLVLFHTLLTAASRFHGLLVYTVHVLSVSFAMHKRFMRGAGWIFGRIYAGSHSEFTSLGIL